VSKKTTSSTTLPVDRTLAEEEGSAEDGSAEVGLTEIGLIETGEMDICDGDDREDDRLLGTKETLLGATLEGGREEEVGGVLDGTLTPGETNSELDDGLSDDELGDTPG